MRRWDHDALDEQALSFRVSCARIHRGLDGGDLVITSSLGEHAIEIRVQDSGSGIPAEIQDRLFRQPVPSQFPEQASGLGLWLSRLMLQTIGGSVEIEQTGPSGTTMLVKIPLSRARIHDKTLQSTPE